MYILICLILNEIRSIFLKIISKCYANDRCEYGLVESYYGRMMINKKYFKKQENNYNLEAMVVIFKINIL